MTFGGIRFQNAFVFKAEIVVPHREEEVQMFLRKLIFVIAAAALLGGCTKFNASPSVGGKAYVVHRGFAEDTLLYCDATGGVPECWPVMEQE